MTIGAGGTLSSINLLTNNGILNHLLGGTLSALGHSGSGTYNLASGSNVTGNMALTGATLNIVNFTVGNKVYFTGGLTGSATLAFDIDLSGGSPPATATDLFAFTGPVDAVLTFNFNNVGGSPGALDSPLQILSSTADFTGPVPTTTSLPPTGGGALSYYLYKDITGGSPSIPSSTRLWPRFPATSPSCSR